MITRGSIHWVDLGEPVGSRPAKRRPVLVVQSGAYSASALSTVIAVVVTSNTALAAMPGNVFLPSGASGLPRDSVANVTAVVTLDKDDLSSVVGQLPGYLLQDVDQGLRRVLDL
ncbi:MAG TPA: type II toxin-antitoxin system PemK/MazF family toxin [Dermatophilaceae bacterium]|nr:type II toxin-antitoxin system PemK/MazF family toxin [Dermatophilaceae bacterium]